MYPFFSCFPRLTISLDLRSSFPAKFANFTHMRDATTTTAPETLVTNTPSFVPGTAVLSVLVLVLLLVLVIGPPGVG
jgi:hypothetical protein